MQGTNDRSSVVHPTPRTKSSVAKTSRRQAQAKTVRRASRRRG